MDTVFGLFNLILIFLVIPKSFSLLTPFPISDSIYKLVPDIIGLQNCSYVHLTNLVMNSYPRWFITKIEQNAVSNVINTDTHMIYIDSWSNKVDQLIFAAFDNSTNRKYVQMVNLLSNSSYNFTSVSGFNFAFYFNKQYVLMIDEQYPYQIYNGSLKLNNFIQIFYFPPISLSPSQLLASNKFGFCMWLMNEGMLVNYPMIPNANFISILNEKITRFVFATVNSTNFLYTGTQFGLVFQWIQVLFGEYIPNRVVINGARNGSSIKNFILFKNQTLLIQNTRGYRQNIHLLTSTVTESFNTTLRGCNYTIACENTLPLIRLFYRVNGRQLFQSAENTYSPTIGPILISQTSNFHNLNCSNQISEIQHSPNAFGNHTIYDCFFDEQIILEDPTFMSNTFVSNCIKYTLRHYSVCRQCEIGYQIQLQSQVTPYGDYKTACIEIITKDNSTQENKNQIFQQFITIAEQAIEVIKAPFFYMKNILQVTLLAFAVHSLLSLWILLSLYYFLPFVPQFLKNILLIMWKTYNTSILAVVGINQPSLPRLNCEDSTLDYGDVIISNDFLQFSFDPLTTLVITIFNYYLYKILRKLLRYVLKDWGSVKLEWLKIQIFESMGDIIIELLPVLFLPSSNFLFHPHFKNMLGKVNLIIFSGMASVGIVFPFFYFCKLIKKRKKSLKAKKQNRQAQNKNYDKSILKKTLRLLKAYPNEIDSFLTCLLHLTIPISVTLGEGLPFLIGNGIIVMFKVLNVFAMKGKKLNKLLHKFYLLLYHMWFTLMYAYKQENIGFLAGVGALATILISLTHEVLQLVYHILKGCGKFIKFCKNRNRIRNIRQKKRKRNQEKLQIKEESKKKTKKPEQQLKEEKQMMIKQKKKQKIEKKEKDITIQKNLKLIFPRSNKIKNSVVSQLQLQNKHQINLKIQTLQKKQTDTFFSSKADVQRGKTEFQKLYQEIAPFTAAVTLALNKSKIRRKLKHREEKFSSRFDPLKKVFKVQKQTKYKSQSQQSSKYLK